MPQKESLLIVPVTLDAVPNIDQPNVSANTSGFCTITLAHAEITFQNGVEERIIQTIMKELMHR